MKIAAVYLQPVLMEPAGMMQPAAETDIHLEADIQAMARNPHGFPEGAWVPYLNVQYKLLKKESGQTRSGHLMPMVASDGPHYGDNIKLFGPGKYKLTYIIHPPAERHGVHFGRHVDKETGVAPWFKKITVDYTFTFVGLGKKGGY